MKKLLALILTFIMIVGIVYIPSFAAASPVLKIEDDFENGLDSDTWRDDASGVIVESIEDADGVMNSAAYLPYNSSGSDTKNHRLRNTKKYLSITDHAVIEFDLMIEKASQTDEYLRMYGVDAKGNAITSFYMLSYHYKDKYLYINGKANARCSLEYNTWCSIVADVDINSGKYSVYVNGQPLTNNDGSMVFDIPYASSYTGAKYGDGATLREVELLARRQGGAIWVDNVSFAKRFYTEGDYGFYDVDGNETSVLDPVDTVYKASFVNNGITDESFVFFLAGYNTSDKTLEHIVAKECTVKAKTAFNIEEHIKYLGNKVTTMKYKAFYVKDNISLTPYTILPRKEAQADTGYIDTTEPYKHVFVIGVDGMGTFSRSHAEANERVTSLFADGNMTYDMLVSVPTVSSHSWASCLTGVTPDLHGLNSNTLVEKTARDVNSKYPTILSIVDDEIPDAKVASIAVWGGINTGIVETKDGIYKYKGKDAEVTSEVVRYISEELSADDTSLTYVHFNSPDAYGHSKGYGADATINAAYLNEVNYITKQIKKINDALAENGMLDDTLFIVTSDHGGTTVYKEDGTPYGEHGGLTDNEKYAIFAIKGKNVVTDAPIGDMEIRDVSAIVLYALGLDIPSYMSARIPENVFEGVPSTERTVYNDPDNPRYHESEATPPQTSTGYITNFVQKNLVKYLAFDGNSADKMGGTAQAKGNTLYVPGFFGEAACLNDGYIEIDGFNPEESYTISLWVKSAMAYKDASLMANKEWEKADAGFVFSFQRSSDTSFGTLFNIADGTNYKELKPALPSDYDRGWMHVLLIVDRENNKVGISYDFNEPVYTNVDASVLSYSIANSGKKLYIGEDATGAHTFKMGLSVDEFMLFDGAFDANDIASLKRYYNK